ncbi:MAG: branched-chain amino acid ABC transporter substrate-binding protein [Candidatus Dormibacteraceae bacterium]
MRSSPGATATISIALLFGVSACSGGNTGAPSAATIAIGADLPLSGGEGAAGLSTLNGVRFFVHSHPTLDGFNIAIDARDDPFSATRDTSRGVKNVQALISQPQVLAVVGPIDANVARAQIPIANRAHLALVSPGTSSRCLTKVPFLPAALNPARMAISCKMAGLPSPSELRPTGINNFFRLSTTDDLQGPAAADYASKQLHLQRMAVLTDGEAYGQGLADGFTASFNRLGGTVVLHQDLDLTKTLDAGSFLRAAKNDGAQGVYFGGTSSNHACTLLTQVAGVIGPDAPVLGGDGIALDPACIADAGAAATSLYATVPAADAERVGSARPVIAAFKAQYGRPGDYGPYTIAAYDATAVIYDALDRAVKAAGGKMPARDSVVAELAATTAFSGATGTFGFDPQGDTTLRIVSIFRPVSSDPDAGWVWAATRDYSATLPY